MRSLHPGSVASEQAIALLHEVRWGYDPVRQLDLAVLRDRGFLLVRFSQIVCLFLPASKRGWAAKPVTHKSTYGLVWDITTFKMTKSQSNGSNVSNANPHATVRRVER